MHIVHEKIEAIEKYVLGLLLAFGSENRALKSRDNPQMKSRDPVLRGIAGDAHYTQKRRKEKGPPLHFVVA